MLIEVPGQNKLAFSINNFFTETECDEILGNITGEFKDSLVSSVRNNSRLFMRDSILLDKIWQRIKVLEELSEETITGIDEEMIIYRYREGEFFRERHSNNNRLMIYIFLNDGYEGGEINFTVHEKLVVKKRLKDIIHKTEIKPIKGKMICFMDSLSHEDMEINTGEKYILCLEVYR